MYIYLFNVYLYIYMYVYIYIYIFIYIYMRYTPVILHGVVSGLETDVHACDLGDTLVLGFGFRGFGNLSPDV